MKNKILWIGLSFYFLMGSLILFFFEKGTFELWINKQNNPFFDLIFKYGTHIGDGLFSGILALLIILFRWKIGIAAAISFALAGGISQFLKLVIFPIAPRPDHFFRNKHIILHYVEGVFINVNNSFPSGHTTTAFACFVFLSLWSATKSYTIIWLFLAAFVALSRVYLVQHFWIDTFFGALLGSSISILVWFFAKKYDKKV
jgi:membrane-associated phospholipid phosphatase